MALYTSGMASVIPVLVISCSLLLVATNCEKILVFPISWAKSSVLRNLEKLASIIGEEGGHEIHVLARDAYTIPDFLVKLGAKHIPYPTPEQFANAFADDMVLRFSLASAEEERRKIKFRMGFNSLVHNCEAVVSSKETVQRLKNENYDLILVDAIEICGPLVASLYKDVPVITFLTFEVQWRIMKKEYPYPASYLPMPVFTAKMTFLERVANVLVLLMASPMYAYWDWKVTSLAREYGIEMKPYDDSLAFVLGGFPVEDPAPFLPDTVYLDGALVSQPKTLPDDIEDFIETFGHEGVVILSFGSMVRDFGEHYVNVFVEAFRQLPFAVLWKYDGPEIANLGNNTKVMKWLPQTDILAHPKTKVFITHCGINSAYETVYYGIPVVAIPVFGDQPGNAAKLVDFHEIGIKLNLKSLSSEDLVGAITQVATELRYKSNAEKLSRQLKDKPLGGRELIMFWVNYMLRHKNVKHLKPFGRYLPFYQFYLFDVIAFLMVVIVCIGLATICCCRFMYRRCCRRRQAKQKTS